MIAFIVVWGILSMPVVAWVLARFLVLQGYLWCLAIYPERVDRFIYSKASPYLSQDMVIAAEQMEFLEVWIVAAILLEVFFALILWLLRDRLK